MKIFLSLLILFVTLPLIELAILFFLVKKLSLLYTLTIVLLTGIIGAWLAKMNGRKAWLEFRAELKKNRLPARQMLDCALIFAAGLLLVTPGIITDITGFFLLIPLTRSMIYRRLKRQIGNSIHIQRGFSTQDSPDGDEDVIDVSAETVVAEENNKQVINRRPGK